MCDYTGLHRIEEKRTKTGILPYVCVDDQLVQQWNA